MTCVFLTLYLFPESLEAFKKKTPAVVCRGEKNIRARPGISLSLQLSGVTLFPILRSTSKLSREAKNMTQAILRVLKEMLGRIQSI